MKDFRRVLLVASIVAMLMLAWRLELAQYFKRLAAETAELRKNQTAFQQKLEQQLAKQQEEWRITTAAQQKDMQRLRQELESLQRALMEEKLRNTAAWSATRNAPSAQPKSGATKNTPPPRPYRITDPEERAALALVQGLLRSLLAPPCHCGRYHHPY